MANNTLTITTDRPLEEAERQYGVGRGESPEERARRQAEVEAFMASPAYWPEQIARAAGLVPEEVGAGAPGAELDIAQSDESRLRLSSLLEQLQQQAATGGGAWEQAFRGATQKAGLAAQALGQSTPGVGYQSQLRNIGNTQGAVAQQAVGQQELLRARAKQAGMMQSSDVLAGQGAQDIDQAIAQARARQGRRATNVALQQQARKNVGSTVAAAGQGAATLATASDGGKVGGEARVFGDDERNDTVPAMLSPGEIVIPRSIAKDPEAAADFVRALNRQGGAAHFANGGQAWRPGQPDPTSEQTFDDPLGGPKREAPSIESGSILESGQSEQSRAANLSNDELLMALASGSGPSVAPQQMQNATDANLIAAMRATAAKRGPASDVVMLGGQAVQGAAGQAGETVAGETKAANTALARSILAQRERDMALARAQQEALWRNTQMNVGLGLEQQAALRGILGTGGQALSTIAASGRRRGGRDTEAIDRAFEDYSHGGIVGGMDEDERRRAQEFIESIRGAA